MPEIKEFKFKSSDGKHDINVRICVPEGKPKGIVQIAHGIAEHSRRYEAFLQFLAENGYVAAANDHLGHGKSVADESELGFFAEKDGWKYVVDDIQLLHKKLCADYPGVPSFLFGHSMGSFLTRTYIVKYPEELDGAIICGTGQQAAAIVAGGRFLSWLVCLFKGRKYRSKFLEGLAFGSYNKEFEPIRTICDWLSRNEASVDDYIADPLCGFRATAGIFNDMMGGIAFVGKKSNIAKVRKDLPVFFIAGAKDPVGEDGKGVKKVYNAFKEAGVADVDIKLYPECRHEILNELNGDEVMGDVLAFIEKISKK